MKVALGFGGEVDIVTKDEMTDFSDGLLDGMKKAFPRRRKPLLRRIPTSGIMPAAGVLILNFATVPAGYTFEIVHVVVVGGDAKTVVANASAALYIGSASSYSLGNVVQPGIAVPGFWNLNGVVMHGHFGDEIFVEISGAVAAGANLAATLTVLQHIEDTVEAGAI